MELSQAKCCHYSNSGARPDIASPREVPSKTPTGKRSKRKIVVRLCSLLNSGGKPTKPTTKAYSSGARFGSLADVESIRPMYALPLKVGVATVTRLRSVSRWWENKGRARERAIAQPA
jgi:hypothetical protein